MDNCDLEKLSISGGKLQPAFKADILSYKVTAASNVNKVTLDLQTSDCAASYKILFGDGSNTIKLSDGMNVVEVEVVAEDGTSKKYCIEVIKLSARTAELSDLAIEGVVQLHPEFSAKEYEYSSTAPFYCHSVTILPKLPDKNMRVTVNGESSHQSVALNVGDTVVGIKVWSADGSNSLTYTVLITREQIPMAVTFSDEKDRSAYECPVSLSALYRPISISQSEPKHVFSGPYIDMLVRRSKVDPLNDCPLPNMWKVVESDLDKKMSAALVNCFFAYRGCDKTVTLSELGSHILECPHSSFTSLDPKEVTETRWYKEHFESSSTLEIETKHTLEVRSWEKRLQKAIGEPNVDNLCSLAQHHLNLYRQNLPKPGDILQYEEGQSPLDSLELAAVHYASAIKLKPRDPRLHFLLGLVLEQQHNAAEMYGLKKADMDLEKLSGAKSTSRQDDILAVCKLHGFSGTPTLENQLRALDAEHQQLKEQGQSGKADYVQTLYIWLSKRAAKDGSGAVADEESGVFRASLKFLDAWSLSPDSWEFNLHAGRLLLLQGRKREALQHLQTGLALRPAHPALRFYTGLALLQKEGGISEKTEREAALYLQQGLEHIFAQFCCDGGVEPPESDPLMLPQSLRGFLSLGALQTRNTLSENAMSAEQVYHNIAALAARAAGLCVCRGEVACQLEWVLLEAHFALLQGPVQRAGGAGGAHTRSLVARRCQALTALIRLTCIAPCRELLDMQEKACQTAVLTTPRDGRALCLLGLAQLAQCDSDPGSERSKVAMADACLSLRASVALEDTPRSGDPPTLLTKQHWWQEQQRASAPPASEPAGGAGPSAGRGSGRGRGGLSRGGAAAAKTAAPARGGKSGGAAKPPVARGRAGAAAAKTDGPSKAPGKPSSKTQLSSSKAKARGPPSPDKAPEGSADESRAAAAPLNRRSHVARLGLARALSRSPDTEHQARQLYQEVIAMAPTVHDAYVELAELLERADAAAALEVYLRFPLRPVAEQTFDDAFITGEMVRILMKMKMYDHPELGPSLIAHSKVMGLGCIEKYIDILDENLLTPLLKSVYAGVHDKSVDDKDLQDFFKFKCWI